MDIVLNVVEGGGRRPVLQEVGHHVTLALDPDGATTCQGVPLRLQDLSNFLGYL